MSDLSGSSTEKKFDLFSAPTPCSTTPPTPCSTSFSQISLKSIIGYSRRWSLFQSNSATYDIEAEAESCDNHEADDDEDDEEMFKAGGPEQTKVRDRE